MEDINLKKNLINFINLKKTILGVGPMSMNCIDAANNLSNRHKIPMFFKTICLENRSIKFLFNCFFIFPLIQIRLFLL